MEKLVKISTISYLNTAPFAYGLRHSDIFSKIQLLSDYPSECARKLQYNEVDISLLPVGALPSLSHYEVITDFCIGAIADVRTVVLLSNSPLHRIRKIYLDYQSRTSVQLVRILSRYYWNINPEWVPLSPEQDYSTIPKDYGIVLIGDRVFEVESRYQFVYDLSGEWGKFTGLPFVFAVWAAASQPTDDFKHQLNHALQLGVNSIPQSVDEFALKNIERYEAIRYLNQNISYPLDAEKRKAISLFLSYMSQNQ